MQKKIFSLTLLIVIFFAVFFNIVNLLTIQTASHQIKISQLADSATNQFSEMLESVHSHVETINNNLIIKKTFFNKTIMENLLKKLNLDLAKNAIKMRKNDNYEYLNSEENIMTLNDWEIDPELFQQFFLKILAEKINFLNLRCEFRYFNNFQAVQIKIIDQDNSDNFVEKYYYLAKI